MSLPSFIDTLLDRTIAPGYGNVGLQVRKRLPGWPEDPPRMDGKVVLVTGAASGIGLASCIGFAGLGARVLAVGRNAHRAADAVRDITTAVPGADVEGLACDVSSIEDVRRFLAELIEQEDRLDVLVNNAGVMPDEREESADGVELTFATQVLAPWLLIDGLHEFMARSGPARIINVSSGGMYGQQIAAGDLETEEDSYSPKKVYARTKRCLMTITEQWADKLQGTGVVVHAMHPGWADTPGVQNWMPVFRAVTRPIIRDSAQGADTVVWMGAAPEVERSSGLFWHDRRPRPTHYLIGAGEDSEDARAAVWAHCERLAHASVASST